MVRLVNFNGDAFYFLPGRVESVGPTRDADGPAKTVVNLRGGYYGLFAEPVEVVVAAIEHQEEEIAKREAKAEREARAAKEGGKK